MTTSDRQWAHLRCIARLVSWAAQQEGYKLTSGDAYRDPRAFGARGETGCAGYGNEYSQHKERLAHDFNLFIGGNYRTDSGAYIDLARYWESLHPECRWGGRYSDGNHFETVAGYDNTTQEPL